MGPDCKTGNRLLNARIIIIVVTTENVKRRLVKRSWSPRRESTWQNRLYWRRKDAWMD